MEAPREGLKAVRPSIRALILLSGRNARRSITWRLLPRSVERPGIAAQPGCASPRPSRDRTEAMVSPHHRSRAPSGRSVSDASWVSGNGQHAHLGRDGRGRRLGVGPAARPSGDREIHDQVVARIADAGVGLGAIPFDVVDVPDEARRPCSAGRRRCGRSQRQPEVGRGGPGASFGRLLLCCVPCRTPPAISAISTSGGQVPAISQIAGHRAFAALGHSEPRPPSSRGSCESC